MLNLDFNNAFGEIDPLSMLNAVLGASNSVRDLAPLAFARLSPAARIAGLSGVTVQHGQTGDPLLPLLYCLAIQPHLKWAGDELSAVGGAARAQMDDAHLLGPIPDVLRVGTELGIRMKECRQTLNKRKCLIMGNDTDAIRAALAANPD